MNRDEAMKKSDHALKELVESLKQGYSKKLLEYLGTMSRFHQYSFGCIKDDLSTQHSKRRDGRGSECCKAIANGLRAFPSLFLIQGI